MTEFLAYVIATLAFISLMLMPLLLYYIYLNKKD